MANRSVWLQALQESLTTRSSGQSSSKGNWLSFRRRSEYEIVCSSVEEAMRQAGADVHDPEWQAAKAILKAVYDRTCEAAERGYNFYQFTLGNSAVRDALSHALVSAELQDSLRMWSRRLGWESADVVDWTSVAAGRPSGAARSFSHEEEQYTVRLQGFWAAGQRDRRAEQYGFPVLRTVRERMP